MYKVGDKGVVEEVPEVRHAKWPAVMKLLAEFDIAPDEVIASSITPDGYERLYFPMALGENGKWLTYFVPWPDGFSFDRLVAAMLTDRLT